MKPVRVSVVLVSFGTRDLTLQALESTRRAGEAVPLEALVVDNASPDDSAVAVAREHPWATLIRSKENTGFATGANLGARGATGDWLLFLNSDARLLPETLPRLLEIAERLPRPGAIGPRIRRPDGRWERSAGRFYSPWRDTVEAFHLHCFFPRSRLFEGVFMRRYPGAPTEVDWVTGACLFVQREAFEDVGGFDEAFFLYVEDMDLCFRLRRAGRRNYYVPTVSIDHEQGKSHRPEIPIFHEGGAAPEYFVHKNGIRYPLCLQRVLRSIMLAGFLPLLEGRRIGRRLRGRGVEDIEASSRLCRRSLLMLIRSGCRPRPLEHPPAPSPPGPR